MVLFYFLFLLHSCNTFSILLPLRRHPPLALLHMPTALLKLDHPAQWGPRPGQDSGSIPCPLYSGHLLKLGSNDRWQSRLFTFDGSGKLYQKNIASKHPIFGVLTRALYCFSFSAYPFSRTDIHSPLACFFFPSFSPHSPFEHISTTAHHTHHRHHQFAKTFPPTFANTPPGLL